MWALYERLFSSKGNIFFFIFYNSTMSEPPSPRSTLTIHKHHRNASFSVRSDTSDEVDKSRKFFTTWRTACDRTKDKTRELLKRTLSWKGQDYSVATDLSSTIEETNTQMSANPNTSQRGWSVHIWSKLIVFPSQVRTLFCSTSKIKWLRN